MSSEFSLPKNSRDRLSLEPKPEFLALAEDSREPTPEFIFSLLDPVSLRVSINSDGIELGNEKMDSKVTNFPTICRIFWAERFPNLTKIPGVFRRLMAVSAF